MHDTPTTPWAGLPVPQGRCARFYLPTGPSRHSDHPLGRTVRPPRPVCPVLHPHRPCRTLRPPPGQDSPSPKADVPGSTSPQALQDTPTTPWVGLPVPPGRCARIYLTTGPAGHSDHPLGRTPRPPRPVCPNLHPHRPCKTLRPPPGQNPPSPRAGVPGSTSPQAVQDTPTTPWAELPIPPGRCARFYLPTSPSGHSDHPLDRTPRPPRPVCPNLPPHRPCRTLRPPPGQDSPPPQAGVPRPFKTLRPPPGQDSPSPQAGVPKSTSPQALQDTPTTPWAGLPVPQGRCARFYLPTGTSGHSDHPLGRTPRPPRAGVPGSTSPQALQDTPTTPWAALPVPPGRFCNLHSHRPCKTLRPPPGQNSPSP